MDERPVDGCELVVLVFAHGDYPGRRRRGAADGPALWSESNTVSSERGRCASANAKSRRTPTGSPGAAVESIRRAQISDVSVSRV